MFILNFPTGLGIACRRAATTTIGCLCLAIALLLVACDDGPADTEGPQETSAVSAEVTAAATLVATPEGTPSPMAEAAPFPQATPVPRLASTTTPTAQPSPMPSQSPIVAPAVERTDTATPTPTLAPTSTPLPPPEPAVYSVQELTAGLRGDREGTITAEISWSVLNVGGSGGPDTIPVSLAIDGGEPEVVEVIPRPSDASPVHFNIVREVEPRMHTVLVKAGDAEEEIDLDARTPDISVTSIKHAIRDNGSITLQVGVVNGGEVNALDTVLTADLALTTLGTETSGSIQECSISLELMVPGETYVVDFPFEVPSGTYLATLRADTETPEALLDNNGAEASLDVEYVDLVTLLESVETVGYENDGDGVVDATVRVSNNGVAPSGPIDVGISCLGDFIEGCAQSVSIESVPAGEDSVVHLTVFVPQGEVSAVVFSGENEDGYRWGDANVQETTIVVPSKPAVSLAMEAAAEVKGYWSNGTAEVELTASLRNEGYQQISDIQVIDVACHQDGEALSDCGGELSIELSGGLGPSEGSLKLSAPMGSILQLSLQNEADPIELEVPERILGVDSYIWECYSDRPGDCEGCGGWARETIVKWDIDRPVKLWRTGSADYKAVSLPVLRELNSLLGLEFELVDSEEEADVKAYLGVPRSTAIELGWPHCVDKGGCASWSVADYRVTHGTIGVWHQEAPHVTFEYVRAVILHELLHVMAPLGHRNALDTRLATDSGLSVIDEEMIRLHAHPLIRPGMTIDEVEGLIVLNDDLLDPQPLGPYRQVHQVVRQVHANLQEAGSVRFRVSGEWRGTCGSNPVGPAVYELGDIEDVSAGIVRYRDSDNHYLILNGSEYWSESNGAWERIDSGVIWEATYWSDTHPNPFSILTSILALGNDKNIAVVRRSDGKTVIKTSNPLTERVADVTLTTIGETHHMESYEEMIRLRRGCRLVFGGDSGEYGIDIQIPDEIVQALQSSDDEAGDTSR